MSDRPSEESEWVSERIEAWIETYKKAMLTPVIMQIVIQGDSTTVSHIAAHITQITGWRVTERGLYRTLKRLETAGFLISIEAATSRTGAKLKKFSATSVGVSFADGIRDNLISPVPDR